MTLPTSCKRLAEVDFPIAIVSRHAAAEKEARSGHIPKIHIWPAARPTAASRSILLALLLPDPSDSLCPGEFKSRVRALLPELLGQIGPTDEHLRDALLKFIGMFSDWALAADSRFLAAARGLVAAVYSGEPPLIVDSFAGGGSIPLEALRLGCDAFASDLNPVAVLINKVILEDIPRYGQAHFTLKDAKGQEVVVQGLADALRVVGDAVKAVAERELAEFYPPDPDGARPIAYLWARTVRCEAPNCGAEIPLVRSFWLVKKANRKRALRYRVERSDDRRSASWVEFEVFEPKRDSEVQAGTVSRAKATCLCCRAVLPPERVRAQLSNQRGGADVMFDAAGKRAGGARMLAVVTLRPGEGGRHYRLPVPADYQAVWRAKQRLQAMLDQWEQDGRLGLSPVPDEPLPPVGTLGFRVQRYGMMQWSDLFTARQKLALATFTRELALAIASSPVASLASLNLSKMVDMNNNLATWQPHAEIPAHMLTRFAIPMKWDFAEAVPTSESSGTMASAIKRSLEPFPNLLAVREIGSVHLSDACALALPDNSSDVWFIDPPYYDAVPYSDLSDFFFVWLKRTLPGHPNLRDPFESTNALTPKGREAIQDELKRVNGRPKDKRFFEQTMERAFAEGRRVLRGDGIGSVVFAHKTTEGWEALLSGMIRGGWIITGSWPIATEMASRLRARDSAALATSIHLICRPRPEGAAIGDWAVVYRELPQRVRAWMERLEGEGIRGADLVFACIGPALELYSRYSQVVDAQDRPIPLGGDAAASEPHQRGYLAYVWETVARIALEQVLGSAEGRGPNGGAGALEEDARLTALFLWTLQSSNGEPAANGEEAEDEEEDEEEEAPAPRRKKGGYKLIFDVARRFAQPLGIHLPAWEGRIIETDKGMVRLLPVSERARQLFGEDGAEAVAAHLERGASGAAGDLQLRLPGFDQEPSAPRGRRGGRRSAGAVPDEALRGRREATTLDRVHAAMLLQKAGRAQALRSLLAAEQARGPDFLRLANALSALYPRSSEDKRLLDAMLLAVPK